MIYKYNKAFWAFLFILILKSFFMILFILNTPIGLSPDEAQYWTWSQALDWGYYSKPPGIAWQIFLGTKLFGNTELGIRFPAIIMSDLIGLFTFFLAYVCKMSPKQCFWAGLVMALSPMGILSSFLSTTDGGLVLFWTIATIISIRFIIAQNDKDHLWPYIILGIAIAVGALFKWPIYFFWFLLLTYMIVFRPLYFKQPKVFSYILIGIIISLLGFIPSVVWNMQHDWATFKHVASTIQGGPQYSESASKKGNFFDFIGAQAALLSPIFFILLIIAFWIVFQKRKTIKNELLFCAWISFIPLVGYALMSVFQKIQGNWVVYAYPTAIILLCWIALEKLKWGQSWLMIGSIISIILSISILSLPTLQSNGSWKSLGFSCQINPFKHNVGWRSLENALNTVNYDSKRHFLIGDKYQTVSLLSFYNKEQKRAYFFNLNGIRKNQFSYWPSLKEAEKGNSGFFVHIIDFPNEEKMAKDIKKYKTQLQLYFEQVQLVDSFPLYFCEPELVKIAIIFKCDFYNGQEPFQEEFY